MHETLFPYLAYAAALSVAAAIPGPGVFALVGRALGSDMRRTLPFLLGLAFGDVVFLTIAILGLSVVATAFAGVFTVVKIAGAFYLLYLAYRFLTAEVAETAVETVATQRPWLDFASGLAVTLGNPKVIVFYMALLPNLLDLTAVTGLDWVVLSVLTMLILLGVLLPYTLLATRLRRILAGARARRRLNRAAALVIGGAGAVILVDAARSE